MRNPESSKVFVESEIDSTLWTGRIFYEKCDTGDFQSVRDFAEQVQKKFPVIHLLINNGESYLSSSMNLR